MSTRGSAPARREGGSWRHPVVASWSATAVPVGVQLARLHALDLETWSLRACALVLVPATLCRARGRTVPVVLATAGVAMVLDEGAYATPSWYLLLFGL